MRACSHDTLSIANRRTHMPAYSHMDPVFICFDRIHITRRVCTTTSCCMTMKVRDVHRCDIRMLYPTATHQPCDRRINVALSNNTLHTAMVNKFTTGGLTHRRTSVLEIHKSDAHDTLPLHMRTFMSHTFHCSSQMVAHVSITHCDLQDTPSSHQTYTHAHPRIHTNTYI